MENQNNSLQEEISQLQILCKRMEDMEMNESRFEPPATEKDILDWERTNDIRIPESYKEWLRFSDGSQIFTATARFFGIEEMAAKATYIPEDLICIGELIGDGELLCFSKTTGKIVKLFEGRQREFDSFREILRWLIRMGTSKLGEDKTTNELGAKMLAMLEAKKNSLNGLSDEQSKILAMLETKKKWGE